MSSSEAPFDPQRLQQWSCQRQLGQLRIPLQYLEQNQGHAHIALAREGVLLAAYLLLVLGMGTLRTSGPSLLQGAMSTLFAVVLLGLWPPSSASKPWLQRLRCRMHRGLRHQNLRRVRHRIHHWHPSARIRSAWQKIATGVIGLLWIGLLQPQPENLYLIALQCTIFSWALSRMAQCRDRIPYLWMWRSRLHQGLVQIYHQQRAILAPLVPAAPLAPKQAQAVAKKWGLHLYLRNRARHGFVLSLILIAVLDRYYLPGQLFSTLLLLLPPLWFCKQTLIALHKPLRQHCLQGWDRPERHRGYGLFLPSTRHWSWLQLGTWGFPLILRGLSLLGLITVLACLWPQPLAMLGITCGLLVLILQACDWAEREVSLFYIEQLEHTVPGSNFCSGPPAKKTKTKPYSA